MIFSLALPENSSPSFSASFLSENDETYDILIDHLDRLLQSAETDFNIRDCLARILANLINSNNSTNEKHRTRLKASKKILSVIIANLIILG